MAQAKSLFSVNFAVEVDVTGQVNAELAGGRYLGAVGGQVDFVRGAQYSQGGRSIIALPSTTPNGKTSRIAAIAHPDFRDELLACQSASTTPPSRRQLRQAVNNSTLSRDLALPDIHHPHAILSSPSQTVLVEMLETGAVRIWLNRPEKLNAPAVGMVGALAQVIGDAVAAGATAIFIRTKGRGFCAGADLKKRGGMTEAERHGHIRAINAAADALMAAPVPTIAVINGVAMWGGLEPALGCYIRIAAESAQIGLTESRIGAIPGAGGTQRLPRLIGISRALDMMYSGEPVLGRKAFEFGLVNVCVPDEGLDNAVSHYAEVLGSRSSSAARILKKVVYEGMEMPLAAGLEPERQALGAILGSADYAEGLAAFAAKRPPRFS